MKGGAAGRRRPRNPTADPQAPAAGGRALRAAASRPRRAGGACRRAERGAAAAAEATATAATDRVGGWAALPGARVRMGAPPRRRPRPTAAAQNGGGRGSGGGGKKVMAATRRLSSPVHPRTCSGGWGRCVAAGSAAPPRAGSTTEFVSSRRGKRGGSRSSVAMVCPIYFVIVASPTRRQQTRFLCYSIYKFIIHQSLMIRWYYFPFAETLGERRPAGTPGSYPFEGAGTPAASGPRVVLEGSLRSDRKPTPSKGKERRQLPAHASFWRDPFA